ncbi:hypothetical protein MPH_02984, partial [Macrophomina phaseolina MS6]
TSYSSVSTTL